MVLNRVYLWCRVISAYVLIMERVVGRWHSSAAALTLVPDIVLLVTVKTVIPQDRESYHGHHHIHRILFVRIDSSHNLLNRLKVGPRRRVVVPTVLYQLSE